VPDSDDANFLPCSVVAILKSVICAWPIKWNIYMYIIMNKLIIIIVQYVKYVLYD